MAEFKLKDLVNFSEEIPVSKNLYDSQKASVRLICLDKGQSILQDSKDQKLIVIVSSGNGYVVSDAGEHDVEEGTFILFESGEPRTLSARTRMTVLVTTVHKR